MEVILSSFHVPKVAENEYIKMAINSADQVPVGIALSQVREPNSTIGENRQLALQMNRLSLRNNWLKFKTAGKLAIILEEFIEYTPF